MRKHHVCEKNYVWNPSLCTCENGKYLGSINDNLIVTCGEIIEVTETVSRKNIPTKSITKKLFQEVLMKEKR